MDFRPVRWQPPSPAPSRPEPGLCTLQRFSLPAAGPEDVRLDASGRVVTGLADGSVVRLDLHSGAVETLAHTGGRPLGLYLVDDDELLVCDARRGLLRVSGVTHGRTRVEVLVAETDGVPLRMASNVDRAPDGTVYFTASSTRWPLEQYPRDLLEGRATGRLLRWRPNEPAEVLRDGLGYANGVVVAPDGSHVWVAETGRYRVSRWWLTGERAGTGDVLADNLPGFPDNMSLGSDGRLWVALAAGRNLLLDRLSPSAPALRAALARVPVRAIEGPRSPAAVVTVDPDTGAVREHLVGRRRRGLRLATSVVERDGRVVLGSVAGRYVGVVDRG